MSLANISFDGSPVQFRLDSPLVVCVDPSYLEFVHDEMSSMSPDARANVATVLWRINTGLSVMSCYQLVDFKPGLYTLDPRDILKFDSEEDEDLDFEELQEECAPVDAPRRYPFVGTDSAALVVADFAHLFKLLELFTWDQYDLLLRGEDSVVEKIIRSLGGPYFALVSGGCLRGMEFDGDGTYTIKANAIRASSG